MGSNPPRGTVFFSVVIVVCCQVEVSATSWSFVLPTVARRCVWSRNLVWDLAPKQRKSTDLITEKSGLYFKRREMYCLYPQHPDCLGEAILLPVHLILTTEPGTELNTLLYFPISSRINAPTVPHAYVTSSFRRVVDESCVLLWRYAAHCGDFLPKLSGSSSRIKKSS